MSTIYCDIEKCINNEHGICKLDEVNFGVETYLGGFTAMQCEQKEEA